MFLGVKNNIFLNISNHLSQLILSICSIPTIIITTYVIISNVSIKRIDCTWEAITKFPMLSTYETVMQEGKNFPVYPFPSMSSAISDGYLHRYKQYKPQML